MTNGTARARLRFANSNGFRDPRRTGIEQNGKSARMKILARPGDVLAALFACPAVTTGRFAPDCANEERALFARLFYFFGGGFSASRNYEEAKPLGLESQHTARLTPPGRVIPCQRWNAFSERVVKSGAVRRIYLKSSSEKPIHLGRSTSIRPRLPAFADRFCIAVDVDVPGAIDAFLHRFGRVSVFFLQRFEKRPEERQRKKTQGHVC